MLPKKVMNSTAKGVRRSLPLSDLFFFFKEFNGTKVETMPSLALFE
jgi:hypothetical protein